MERNGVKHMFGKLCALILAALCLSLVTGCAGSEPAAAPTPAPQETAVPAATPEPESGCDALFYGDSITAGNNFDKLFPELRIVDFGINGATIEDLTDRVDEVAAYEPKKIFLMTGGNDLDSTNADLCLDLYRGLLDALESACPDAEIFLESMLPVEKSIAASWNCPNRVRKAFNARIAELAEEYGLTYIDIYPVYEYKGELKHEYTEDGVHLKYDCFGPWAEVIRPYLEP